MRSYSRTQPDYGDADAWLRQNIDAELIARYPWATPTQRQEFLEREEGFLVASALQNNQDPAQIIYNLAKTRGYKPKGAEPQENKLERLKAGQKASASLSSTKGAGNVNGADNMTLEALSELMVSDPEKADELWDKMAKRGLL